MSPTSHILAGAVAVIWPLLAAACKHDTHFVYAMRGADKPAMAARADSVRLECPKCYRLLVCCREAQFAADGKSDMNGVAWACPVHGYVATTKGTDILDKTCSHSADKSPARVTDPQNTYPPAVILRCTECGAGGKLILEQKGRSQIFYCAD